MNTLSVPALASKLFAKTALVAVLSTSLIGAAQAEPSMDELLALVKKGNISISEANKAREQEFLNNRSQREQLLAEIKTLKAELEATSATLESTFEANEISIDEAKVTLDKRLGSLKELFGVMQGATSDFNSGLTFSLTNAQISGRQDVLAKLNDKMAQSTQLPNIDEIANVWALMQQEMIETGKTARFETDITLADGSQTRAEVVRIGAFNVISQGQYLSYVPQSNKLMVLARQPTGSALQSAAAISDKTITSGVAGFSFDPTGATGGSLLAALVDTPTLRERIDQGGLVGYIILAVGLIGLLVALERFVGLLWLSSKVNWQVRNKDKKLGMKNPLGRVLAVYNEHRAQDVEALELKISEAILEEVPKINKRIGFIKLIAMVAPLMGLLGTVTGMIVTFQQISIFGAGDPKTMAGGISAALMTTVFGLVVAIPTLLLHAILHGKARGIVNIIEQQSTGLIAETCEARIPAATSTTKQADAA